MILLCYILINVVAIFLFIKKKKNLHILEIIIYWMVSSYFFQNLSALCYMNFKTFIIPDKLSYELSHFFNRTILYPILMVTFLHIYIRLLTNLKKLLLTIIFIFLLAGVEWLEHFSGVLLHVNWQIWWSFTYWMVTLLTLIGFMKFFRKFLYKGGLNAWK